MAQEREAVLRFAPVPFERIPPPAVREYRQVFADMSSGSQTHTDASGRPLDVLTLEEVYLGFLVNGLDHALSLVERDAFARAIDPDADGRVHFLDFACCVHALALQSREVGPSTKYAVFPDSDFSEETAPPMLRLRRMLWTLFDDPSSSRPAAFVAYFLMVVIFASTAGFIASSYPRLRDASPSAEAAFTFVEVAAVAVFTAEYAVRLLCSPEPKKFFFSFFNLVDFASIAPFYLELMFASLTGTGSGGRLLRSLRLIRVLRLAKIGRYAMWMKVFGRTIELSLHPLGMLAFITGTMIIFWASIMYFLERGEWDADAGMWRTSSGDPSWFTSIPASLWWAIVTMTTVGYGDVYPVTVAGRILSAFTIFTGITLLAIPISIVTGHLHAEYARVEKLRKLRAEHAAQAQPDARPEAQPDADDLDTSMVSKVVEQGAAPGTPAPPTIDTSAAPRRAPLRQPSADFLPPMDALSETHRPASPTDDRGADDGTTIVAPRSNTSTTGSGVDTIKLPSRFSSSASVGAAVGSRASTHTPIAAATPGMEASWSEPFLRSSLNIVRSHRRRLMSALKAAELRNREGAVTAVKAFVADMRNPDRAAVLLRTAAQRGLL